MNRYPIFACLGLAWLAPFACGHSLREPGGMGGAGSGAVPGSAASAASGDSGASDAQGGVGTGGAPARAGSGPNGDSGSTTDAAGAAGAASDFDPQQCTPGNTTTISGVVYDPAGKNPLYNVLAYVADPRSPLPDLDSVPVGCGCAPLLPTKVLARSAPTDETGHFEIPCAPSGSLDLVVQTGKWRRKYANVLVIPNQQNVIPNLRLPANSSEGSLPNIAISTGGSDSFECLPLRFGVSASEYVAGSASGGHIHIYTGKRGATPAEGAVQSFETLWDSQSHLNEHDLVVLSCEGEETAGGNPGERVGATAQQYLMNYANAGGRVLANHYHYAWFSTGPFATGPNNLATWNVGTASLDDMRSFPAEIDTTLSDGAAFPEGSALAKWLGLVSALTDDQLPVWFARSNVKALLQPPSTEWIRISASSSLAPLATQHFSVDMPLGAKGSAVCGRIAYSTLHVSGGPNMNAPGVPPDYPSEAAAGGGAGAPGLPGGPIPGGGVAQGGIVPTGCALHPVTPQEAVLEFALFDLSSCLIPIGEGRRWR
jgi:hypothetical protein